MRGLKLPREFYVPKGAVLVRDKQSTGVAYLYETAGKFGVVAFYGKAQKPAFHFTYRKPEHRESRVREFFEALRGSATRKAAAMAERKAFVHDYKVGDVFRTSWGYDQTNVEYFQVTEVRGKHLIVREIAQEREETGWLQGTCKPVVGKFLSPRFEGDDQGVPQRVLAQKGYIKVDRDHHAWLVKPKADGTFESVGWSSYH